MGTPEISPSTEIGATADETSLSAADVESNSGRVEQLLARLAQAVIAAHARLDAHADEIVTACEQATRDTLDDFVRDTTERVDADATKIAQLAERLERDIEQHFDQVGAQNQQVVRKVADDLASLLRAVNDSLAKRLDDASSRLQNQITQSDHSIQVRLDGVSRTAEDIEKSLLDHLATLEVHNAHTHKWIVSLLVLLLVLVASGLWLLLNINFR